MWSHQPTPIQPTTMTRISARQELLATLHHAALHVLEMSKQSVSFDSDDDDFEFFELDGDEDNNLEPIIIPPPLPIPPIIFLNSILKSDLDSDLPDSDLSNNSMQDQVRLC